MVLFTLLAFIIGFVLALVIYFLVLPALNIVLLYQFAFHPGLLRVRPGATVRWINLDGATHTVTEGTPEDSEHAFASGDLGRFGIFRTTVTEGRVKYHCSRHNFMRGRIVVRE